MSISVRTRFEVFKRDHFTCVYCGRRPPDVLLEADHLVPRAAGGSDDIDNLVTACWDCNHGKADRLLDEGVRPVVSPDVVDATAERVAQAQAYAEHVANEERLRDRFEAMVIDAWARSFGATLTERPDGTYWQFDVDWKHFPESTSIRRFLRSVPVDRVLEAVEITASVFSSPTSGACRYFYAICWRRVRGE